MSSGSEHQACAADGNHEHPPGHALPPSDLHLATVPEQSGGAVSPHATHNLHPPSPIITRRDRRQSLSERAAKNPVEYGIVKYFCRQKGHGYVTPKNGGDDIFLHISDIEGEYVPCEGDIVSYQLCQVPPKFEKTQAIHVCIRNLSPGIHERWAEPPVPHKHPHPTPNTPEVRHPEQFHFPTTGAAVHAAEDKHKEEQH